MRLLVVEDDLEQLEVLEQELTAPGTALMFARSRGTAFDAVGSHAFDLVICDLSIPTSDGVLDAAVEHGVAVMMELRRVAPGTPVIAFSAHGETPGLLRRLLAIGWREDFLGLGEDEPVIVFLEKTELVECVAAARRMGAELSRLDGIELAHGFVGSTLDVGHQRVLQIYGRRRGARVLKLAQLGGGLSEARVVRARLEGVGGGHIATVVAKLGTLAAVDDERDRFRAHVAGSLALGACPNLVGEVRAGAGPLGGLFYELAGDYPDSLFDVLARDPAAAASIVTKLAALVGPWREGASAAGSTVSSVRDGFISTGDVEAALTQHSLGLDQELESSVIQVRTCLQHGDLHGLNVLVSEGTRPILIDFGEVRRAPASTDPVVLELSLLFHPDSPVAGGPWPTVDLAKSWFDLDTYLQGCPFPAFIRACRDWAQLTGVAAGDREVAAVVRGFALRQLKYPETDKPLALAIAGAAAARLRP